MTQRQLIAPIIAAIGCMAIVAACAEAPSYPHAEAPTRAAVAPSTPSAAVPAPAPEADEYHLGAGDTVKITVYNNPDLATETEIAQSGTISFPLIGDVKLAGLSTREAERTISERLGNGGFVPKAHVNLLVTQYRSQQVSVLGEVAKPGRYPISQAANVTDLLAAAGGITPKGSTTVTVVRRDQNGSSQRYRVDVKSLFGAGDVSKNFKLAADDIVYVAPMPLFYIYGEVRQPGAYPLTSDMTVQQALSVGGGLTLRGTDRGIHVDRQVEDGTVKRYRARLTDKLQPNDVVSVPESWF